MLQVLHLDISKVDQVLHMGCVWEMGGRERLPRAVRRRGRRRLGVDGPEWVHGRRHASVSAGVECCGAGVRRLPRTFGR
jgi:hypothetical protein